MKNDREVEGTESLLTVVQNDSEVSQVGSPVCSLSQFGGGNCKVSKTKLSVLHLLL